MTRQIPFQYERPLFVAKPFKARGKSWRKGDHFPWLEMAIEDDIVRALFGQDFLQHHEAFEKTKIVGDGLEALDITGLHQLVFDINEKVRKQTKTQKEYDNKRCKKSTIKTKQIGLIRSWRRNFGEMET